MKHSHRRLAAAAAMLVFPPCFASGLDAGTLDRAIRNLDSAAQEAQALLAAASKGEVPARYATVQRAEIGKLVAEARKPLDDPPPERLAARAARARSLSDKLAGALADGDAAAADSAARALHDLAKGGP